MYSFLLSHFKCRVDIYVTKLGFQINELIIYIIPEARSFATSHDCKYLEVSAALDHNVDTLLVGIVKQIRLKMKKEIRKTKHKMYTRWLLLKCFHNFFSIFPIFLVLDVHQQV